MRWIRDHIFSRANSLFEPVRSPKPRPATRASSLVLSDSLSKSIETVRHDTGDRNEVIGGFEATDWQIPAVLDWLVAAHGRHILRHDGDGGPVCAGEVKW